MKRLIILALTLSIALSIAGCATNNTQAQDGSFSTTAPVAPESSAPTVSVTGRQQPIYAINLPLTVDQTTAEDGTPIFRNIYQTIHLVHPDSEVADKIIVDYLNQTDYHDTWKSLQSNALQAYNDGSRSSLPYLFECSFAPVRVDASILSLFGKCASYTGGAHMEDAAASLTYDMLTGKALTWTDILSETTSPDTLCKMIVEALDADTELVLFSEYKTILQDIFSNGFPNSNDWYLGQEGLCCFFSPYEIGPFSTGTVTAHIPYDKLTGILRDGYFPVEADKVYGNITCIDFEDANLDDYSQFVELTIDADGHKYLLTSDDAVQNITISQKAHLDTDNGYAPTYTIFCANSLSHNDGIVIQTRNPDALTVTYTTNDKQVTLALS